MIAPLAKLLDWLAIQLVWGRRTRSFLKLGANPRLEEAIQFLKSPDFIPAQSAPAQLEFDQSGRHFRFPTPRPGRFAENNTVYGRLYRCAKCWQERPVIILLHGAGGMDYHLFGLPQDFEWAQRDGKVFLPKYICSLPRICCNLITHLSRRRSRVWLARVEQQSDELDRLNLGSMFTPELTRFCIRYIRESFKDADVLYLLTQGAALPVFQKACRDWLGEPGLTLRLFAALGGLPVAEAGLALWRLAALAHGDSDTEAAVASENNWPAVRARLCRTENGRKFLAVWEVFLSEHGHPCRGEFELFNARWCETPDYIMGQVRVYLQLEHE